MFIIEQKLPHPSRSTRLYEKNGGGEAQADHKERSRRHDSFKWKWILCGCKWGKSWYLSILPVGLPEVLVIDTFMKAYKVSGKNGAEREVNKERASCHKRFKTMAQAEAFIEDWKESYAEIWYESIKEELDRGFRLVFRTTQ